MFRVNWCRLQAFGRFGRSETATFGDARNGGSGGPRRGGSAAPGRAVFSAAIQQSQGLPQRPDALPRMDDTREAELARLGHPAVRVRHVAQLAREAELAEGSERL